MTTASRVTRDGPGAGHGRGIPQSRDPTGRSALPDHGVQRQALRDPCPVEYRPAQPGETPSCSGTMVEVPTLVTMRSVVRPDGKVVAVYYYTDCSSPSALYRGDDLGTSSSTFQSEVKGESVLPESRRGRSPPTNQSLLARPHDRLRSDPARLRNPRGSRVVTQLLARSCITSKIADLPRSSPVAWGQAMRRGFSAPLPSSPSRPKRSDLLPFLQTESP